MLVKVVHQQRARLARDLGHGGKETVVIGRHNQVGLRASGFGFENLSVEARCYASRSQNAAARSPVHRLEPPSSAMYIISCLKMNRLGTPSRVSRTMCLS